MREASNHLGGQCGKSNVWHNIVFIFWVWNILAILKDLIYVFQFFSCFNILRCTRENGLVQQQQPIFCRFSTSDYFLHNAFKIYFQIIKHSVFNQNLLENPRLRKIAHAFDWFILPIANPDGYRYSRKVCTGDNGCLKNSANDLIFSEKNMTGGKTVEEEQKPWRAMQSWGSRYGSRSRSQQVHYYISAGWYVRCLYYYRPVLFCIEYMVYQMFIFLQGVILYVYITKGLYCTVLSTWCIRCLYFCRVLY